MKRLSGLILFALLLTGMAGCLKDDGFDDHEYGMRDTNGSPVGIGFPQALNEVNVYPIPLQTTTQSIKLPLVNLLSDVPADQDVHITLQVNQSLVTAYNAKHDPGLIDTLDAATPLIVIPKLDLIIPKGKRNDTLTVQIPNSSLFDASKRYGVGYTISAVQESGVTISENLKNVLFAIAIKNKYHAVYDVNVELTGHPTAAGKYSGEVEFTTVDGNTLDAPLGVAEIFAASSRLYIQIDPDNTLTLSSNAAAVFPIGVNKYDPATQTFYFDYGYSTRHIVGTAKRQ
jgi:hypothetical protein